MKVILLRDVAKLGKRFSVADVPDGFALNKLIPQGMAQAATPENLKRIEARAAKASANDAVLKDAVKAECERLATSPVTFQVDANEQDHLFKAVKTADIITALRESGYQAISGDMIVQNDPIKALGEYRIPVHYDDLRSEFSLIVIRK